MANIRLLKELAFEHGIVYINDDFKYSWRNGLKQLYDKLIGYDGYDENL